jgi:hypothetical protein
MSPVQTYGSPQDSPVVQVFAERLAGFVMLSQPVTGLRGRQRLGEGTQFAFQVRVRF